MAQGQLLCDHSSHGGAYYMSGGHSSRIQNRGCILSHSFHGIRSARGVAAAHPSIIEVDSAILSAQDRQNSKPHVMGKTQTHDEEDRRSAPLLIPVELGSLVGHEWHFPQSSRNQMWFD
jgi:hypothetical protein